MKFKSHVFTQVSGSTGGTTFSHNRGGMYTRSRAIPTNPSTPEQVATRSRLTTLSQRWSTVLTSAQRTAWETYASNVPVTDRLGDPILLSGQQQYVRSNTARMQVAAASIIDDGPTTFNLGEFTAPTSISMSAPSSASIAYVTSDAWVDLDDAYLIVQYSRGQNSTINFFKGPFRFTEALEGDSVSPPASPFLPSSSPFTYAAGQKMFARFRVSYDDGRLTTPFILSTVVT